MCKHFLHGVFLGDIAGSQYERRGKNIYTTDFLFPDPQGFITDDTIMTLAVAKTIMDGDGDPTKIAKIAPQIFRQVAAPYKQGGKMFRQWLANPKMGPYGSFGNGAIMRIMPAGLAARTDEEAALLADALTNPTHNHPDALICAEAQARAIRRLRDGATKKEVSQLILAETGCRLAETLEQVRQSHKFRVTAVATLPIAVKIWQETTNLEEAIRLAVSLGGDADTNAAIAGALAAMTSEIPEHLVRFAESKLDKRLLLILQDWEKWLAKRLAEF